MKVKNTGKKILGFGSLVLLPDEVGELPKGYGLANPTVNFYLKKGYLTEVTDNGATPEEGESASNDSGDDETGETEAAAQKKAAVDAKIKSLDRMGLDTLRKEAVALGVVYADEDTKEVLRKKIADKLQGE